MKLRPFAIRGACLGVLGALALSWTPAAFGWMVGGRGTVLDSSTMAPVANAKVTLECMQPATGHGSITAKVFTTEADAQGRFSFATLDVIFCSHAFVRPHKEGFFDIARVDVRYERSISQIPETIFLAPVGEDPWLTLKYHAAMSRRSYDDGKDGYASAYGEFISARNIAKSGAQVQFVRDSFCPHLRSLNQMLSAADRASLSKVHAGSPPTPIDHDMHVKPYCGRQP